MIATVKRRAGTPTTIGIDNTPRATWTSTSSESSHPMSAPQPMARMVSLMISMMIRPCCAPSAWRTPISTVRREIEYETTA